MNDLHRDLGRLVERAERGRTPSKWRGRFHLEPPVGWLNDPNGLCRLGGEYHFFYQYAPFDPAGGLKFWGHWASPDLLRWERLPAALLPDQSWDCHGVYSGSALVREDGELWLYYTGNVEPAGAEREGNTCLAVSRDGGGTFPEKRLLMTAKDYPAGLTGHVRDPKVWREDGRFWMALGARTRTDVGEALLFSSRDGLRWEHVNTFATPDPFGYMWECPDLFELEGRRFLSVSPQGLGPEELRFQNVYQSGWFPLEGDWTGACRLGAFEEYDHGFDFYAPQTFQDGERRLLVGWMGMGDADYRNPTAGLGWQHALTVPRELFLKDGRICQRPVPELLRLRRPRTWMRVNGQAELAGLRAFDLELECVGGTPVELLVRGCGLLRWEAGILSLSFPRGGWGRTVRRAAVPELRKLRLLADESSLELFVNDGRTVLTSRYYPEPEERGVLLRCREGAVSAWEMDAFPDGRA